MSNFTNPPGGVIGGKTSAAIIFAVLFAIGAVLSFFGMVDFSRAAFGAFMVFMGYLISKVLYKYIEDWVSIIILSTGFVTGTALFLPFDPLLAIFLFALGFGAGVSS